MKEEFQQLTKRLHSIQFFPDHLNNIRLYHCLSVLENYIYGIISQYDRINENSSKIFNFDSRSTSDMVSAQINLDIYYYTLTWDKILKVYEKFQQLINTLQRDTNSISGDFKKNYRIINNKMLRLLKTMKKARNEYEHPSLEPNIVGNIVEWGTLTVRSNGDIEKHVGGAQFSVVKKAHIDRLRNIWRDLMDLFIQNFSNKHSNEDLDKLKKNIEGNIDNIIKEYNQNIHDNKIDEANDILGDFLAAEKYLQNEGLPLSRNISTSFYSNIFKERNT